MGMPFTQKKLEKYVRQYLERNPQIKIIAVAGSVGKTFQKTAIANVVSQKYRTRLFHGNRGTNFTAPLAILGIDYPGDIKGIWAWLRVFAAARKRITQPADVDVIIHEMNASYAGSIAEYARILSPDIAVITAVSPSNMEVFPSVDAIAKEQLTAANISKTALINRDNIDGQYVEYLGNAAINTYGSEGVAEYRYEEAITHCKMDTRER